MATARLVVEGTDDLHSVLHLLQRHGVDYASQRPEDSEPLPQLHAAGDYGQLINSIVATVQGVYERVGFILDADNPLQDRWKSVCDYLNRVNVDTPDTPPEEGFIGVSSSLHKPVGVWLMPDNQRDGTLEDFLKELTTPNTPLYTHAQQSTATARASFDAKVSEKDVPKAELHAWLAWQEEPGCPYGTAISAQYFAHDPAIAQAFVAWFRRLFVE